MYAGVPTANAGLGQLRVPAPDERLGDTEVGDPGLPVTSRMFSGLMSRWTTP